MLVSSQWKGQVMSNNTKLVNDKELIKKFKRGYGLYVCLVSSPHKHWLESASGDKLYNLNDNTDLFHKLFKLAKYHYCSNKKVYDSGFLHSNHEGSPTLQGWFYKKPSQKRIDDILNDA